MTTSRSVRVFLSSTFRDFAEERDLLVRKVFPELRRRARERNVEVIDIDLRGASRPNRPNGAKSCRSALRKLIGRDPISLGSSGWWGTDTCRHLGIDGLGLGDLCGLR